MAEGGFDPDKWSSNDSENLQEQRDEVLAFQSLFEVEGDQRFTVINNGPIDLEDDQMFSLQFLVPVNAECDNINVNVCVPDAELNGNEMHKDLVFQRSESRNRVLASFCVQYLTPLRLTVVLPPGYPSTTPPIFTLSSSWLTAAQLTALCLQLDGLWNECPSMPILNTWIDWLEHNTLSYLGIIDTVFVDLNEIEDENIDTRAVPEWENIEDTVNDMLRYNMYKESEEFLRYDQECGICFCEKSGRDFYRLQPCKHHFCKDCISEHCSLIVKEGTVQNLLCPEPKCITEILPYILHEVLNQEDFKRWEKLILEHGLAMMGDIIYCPRCQNVVVQEEENLGHCLSCLFTFCTKCSEKWHQGDVCFFEKDEGNSEEVEGGGDILKNGGNIEVSQKAAKVAQMKKAKELRLSHKLIKERTRQCNSCKAPIEKNGGCNKVTCTRCYNSMCWGCGKDITKESYGHFKTSARCAMFTNEVVPEIVPLRNPTPEQIRQIEDAILQGGEQVEKNVTRCPRCRQRNLRGESGNNHMKCWNCRSSFCFLCRNILTPPYTKHFLNSLCKQHTKNDVKQQNVR